MPPVSTPVLLALGVGLFFLWKTGVFAKIKAGLEPRPAAPAAARTTSLVDELSAYDSRTLGLAYQRAIRREADDEVSANLASQNRDQAMKAYTAPFSAAADGAVPPNQHGPLK